MGNKLPKLPRWTEKALQGITYWIGHRRCLYDHYPLGESAFVAEICNLIFAHLDGDLRLRCEVSYRELANGQPLPAFIGARARADLVVSEAADADGNWPRPKFVIEVKRGSAPPRDIDEDLKRLAAISRVTPGCRTILFIVSEAKRLERFITIEGQSTKEIHKIDGDVGHYRVRRTFKAAHAFKHRDRAQYACAVEVYSHSSSQAIAVPKRKAGRKAKAAA